MPTIKADGACPHCGGKVVAVNALRQVHCATCRANVTNEPAVVVMPDKPDKPPRDRKKRPAPPPPAPPRRVWRDEDVLRLKPLP